MPPAVALAIPAIAGAGATASSGKKGSHASQDAANQQFQMQQQLFNTGMKAWQPAQQYWSALLSGDPTKMAEATGPARDMIQGQSQANARELAARLPAGGEANAAQAGNLQDTYNQVARLTAGVQPMAAQALGGLAQAPMSLSAPNVGSGLKYNTHQQEQLGQSKGALGQGVGQIIANRGGKGGGGKSGGGKSSGTPTTAGAGGSFPGA